MENNKVILSADDNNESIEFSIENAYELDYIKSMIRDGIVQVKMPIKVKCDYNQLKLVNNYLTLMNDEESKEEYETLHNEIFSIENEYKMECFFNFVKCVHYLRSYKILDKITTYLANEINNCESKEEICKKFNIPEILVEDN